ncbi:TerD family protein [Abyssisolibacter fermentans]|uniref:TerD family protein n=1 Tax=Abyssisolibacter fermentans TaxID=1766203 RepID=UPI0008310E8C|nr:TerD family protein [Abyssisolibacter fermentans]
MNNINIRSGKKESRSVFSNNNVKVDFGEKVIHEGTIDLRQNAKTIQQNMAKVQGKPQNSIHSTNTINNAQVLPQNNIAPVKRKKENTVINTSASIGAKKGQKLSITKTISNVNKVLIGLEWEFHGQYNFELDTSIFMMDTNNKTAEEDFIFYNNLKSRNDAIVLHGDFNKNLKDYYDEIIQLDLTKIPQNIKLFAVTVTIDEDSKNTFKDVKSAALKIIDPTTNKEVYSYSFCDKLTSETAIVVCEIYRHKEEWKINCIGSGFNGGLQALCDNYGIDTK